MQSFKLLGFLWQTKRIFFSLSQGGSKGNAQFRSSVCTVTTIYIPGRRKGGGIRENKVITSWHINVMMLQTSRNVTWSSDTVQTENILAKHSISYLTTQFLFCIIVNLKTSRNCFSSACYGLQNTAEEVQSSQFDEGREMVQQKSDSSLCFVHFIQITQPTEEGATTNFAVPATGC